MITTVLAASGVWKSYDGRSVVLRDVNLEARAGEAVLIWGANGSGKTTLLSILGGLDIPTKGSVVLGGREIARLKESALAKVRLHDVGFVFQTHNLIDDLTVEENVALPLRLARKPADPRVRDLLEAFDLVRLTTRRPNEISVGEAQRVAVARALANGPKVILADEPTSALDAIFIMLTSVISSGLGFFFWLIVANKYAKEDLGAAVTLFQTLGFIGALGNLGIGIGLIRYMGETEDKGKMINAGLTLCGVVTLALCLLFLVLLPVILPDLAFVLNDRLYVLTIVVCTVALGLAPVLDSVTIAVRRADLQTWRLTIFAVLKIPVALLVVTIPLLQGRAGIFFSLALSFGVSVAVLGFVLLPRTLSGYRPKPDFQFRATRPILRFSLGNYVAIAIGSAGALLPTPLIYGVLGPYDGPKNAAYFYVALIVASLLYIIPGAAFTSFYAEASQTNTDRRRGERQAILLSLLLLIPAIAGMWLFSDWMLRLFGDPTYADEAVTPLRILTVASIPAFLNGILGTRVRVRKRSLPLIIAATIATAITLGLGWFLLQNPDLGIDGLAYAYVIGQAAATPYLYFEARESYEAVPMEPLVGQPLE